MPYPRPSLAELARQTASDIQSRLTGTDPLLRRSFVGILARVIAGGLHLLYGFLAWIVDQIFDASADEAELLLRAAELGIRPVPPVAATGAVAVTGTAGTAIDARTIWRSGARIDYRSTAQAAIAADGSASVPVRAVEPGAAGNAAAGTRLALVSPIAGVVSDGTALGTIAGGADRESTDSVRVRLALRRQQPPRGGTEPNYVAWAREAHPAVSRAWARPRTPALGQVTVYFMTDGATANGIPDAAVVTTVKDYIDAHRPVTADAIVAAPAAVPLAIEITNVMPDTPSVRAAIAAEIADLIRRESEPGGTILVSHIREAISTAAGEFDHELTSPADDVDHAANEIAVPGAIAWSTS